MGMGEYFLGWKTEGQTINEINRNSHYTGDFFKHTQECAESEFTKHQFFGKYLPTLISAGSIVAGAILRDPLVAIGGVVASESFRNIYCPIKKREIRRHLARGEEDLARR